MDAHYIAFIDREILENFSVSFLFMTGKNDWQMCRTSSFGFWKFRQKNLAVVTLLVSI